MSILQIDVRNELANIDILESTVSITDSIARQARKFRYLIESRAIIDSYNKIKKVSRTYSEAVNMSDTAGLVAKHFRYLTDIILITDVINIHRLKFRNIL